VRGAKIGQLAIEWTRYQARGCGKFNNSI
jgi:hypothetical protein